MNDVTFFVLLMAEKVPGAVRHNCVKFCAYPKRGSGCSFLKKVHYSIIKIYPLSNCFFPIQKLGPSSSDAERWPATLLKVTLLHGFLFVSPCGHQTSFGHPIDVYMKSGLHIDVRWTSKGRLMPTGGKSTIYFFLFLMFGAISLEIRATTKYNKIEFFQVKRD